MSSKSTLRPISGLLFGCCFLTAANTLTHGALSAVMGLRQLDPVYIAAVMSSYSIGVLIGSLYGHNFIQRVGHIRAFAGLCALIGIVQVVQGSFYSPVTWMALRVLHGIAGVSAYMALESWLHAYATNDNRGRIWGIYQTLVFVGAGSVPMLFAVLEDVNAALPLAAGMVMLALIPMTMSRKRSPDLPEFERLGMGKIFALSQTGAVGALIGGGLLNSILFLLPAYATGMQLSNLYLALFLSATTIGGFFFQYPFGRLADRMDKRKVLLIVLALLAIACVAFILAQYLELSFWVLVCVVLLMGGLASCIYPLSVAETFNYLDAKDAVPAMGTMLLFYSVGSICGPLLIGAAQSLLGAEALFFVTTICAVLFFAFIVQRIFTRTAVAGDEQSSVAYVSQNPVPTQAQLDPRVDYQEVGDKWLSVEARLAGELAQVNVDNAADIARTVIDSVLNSKLNNESDRDVVAQIAAEVARNAPEQASEVVNLLAETIEQYNIDSGQELVQEVATRVADGIPDGAFEVIEEISKLSLVNSLELLRNLAQSKPKLAIRLALEQARTKPEAVVQLVDEIYPYLPEDDPELRRSFIKAMLARSKDKQTMSAIANRALHH